jgi:dipeptidase E
LARLVKLLLTSAGLSNQTLLSALRDLLGKPVSQASIAFVPTASVAQPGDHGWFVADLNRVYGLGWREFDVLELNGLPPQVVLDRLLRADVIYAEGGNPYHLARSISLNGLADGFRKALEDRVYVGVSAGSMIFSRHLDKFAAQIIGDAEDLHVLDATTLTPPLGDFDWYVKPHLYSPNFPDRDDAWADRIAARADFPIYFIDDDTAILVNGDEMRVITEGRWRLGLSKH